MNQQKLTKVDDIQFDDKAFFDRILDLKYDDVEIFKIKYISIQDFSKSKRNIPHCKEGNSVLIKLNH